MKKSIYKYDTYNSRKDNNSKYYTSARNQAIRIAFIIFAIIVIYFL